MVKKIDKNSVRKAKQKRIRATLSGTTIGGIKANLKAPGVTVKYTFYVHNTGEYDAFLNSITHENVTGQNAPKICTAVDTTTTTSSVLKFSNGNAMFLRTVM